MIRMHIIVLEQSLKKKKIALKYSLKGNKRENVIILGNNKCKITEKRKNDTKTKGTNRKQIMYQTLLRIKYKWTKHSY